MENEILIRLPAFLTVFAVMAAWELFGPARRLVAPKPRRWLTNWTIVALDTVIVRLLFPAAAVGAALDAAAQGWGLLNVLDAPYWLAFLVSLLALDLAIWAQHLVFHKVPLLWRLHRVHHADRDVDVSTAIRFHPVEIALSMVIKIGVVYVLGAPALAVVVFEVILNGCAMFNHANIRLPAVAERPLRWLLITPDLHRIHHSVHRREHDSNYGFSVSWWDRLFGTYTPEPEGGHKGMTLGLSEWQDDRPTRLLWSLRNPLLPHRPRTPAE
ncbi:MAG TPA: sterol desaturase family protein [Paracoccaceae bacterium]|nr:sterol desaturase family protein [Paracoccaceae bacterium]